MSMNSETDTCPGYLMHADGRLEWAADGVPPMPGPGSQTWEPMTSACEVAANLQVWRSKPLDAPDLYYAWVALGSGVRVMCCGLSALLRLARDVEPLFRLVVDQESRDLLMCHVYEHRASANRDEDDGCIHCRNERVLAETCQH